MSLWRKMARSCSRRADAVDHGSVVALVREDHAALEHASEHAQAGLVGDESRSEHQRRLLAVQIGELILQLAHEQMRACDVARPARADAMFGEGLARSPDDRRVLAHAKVVVGTPIDHDAGAAVGEPHVRRSGRRSLQLDEAAVPALDAEHIEPLVETAQCGRDRGVPAPCVWRRDAHADQNNPNPKTWPYCDNNKKEISKTLVRRD